MARKSSTRVLEKCVLLCHMEQNKVSRIPPCQANSR
jgi:hypothetical protein